MTRARPFSCRPWLVVASLIVAAPAAPAEQALSASQRSLIDSAASSVLADTGAPGASIAVVWDGRIVYERAYGSGRLAPPVLARTAMRYSIGSVSKQFTATAALLLAEEGRLSLDDKVARWLPELTRANEVSLRQLLSMTAGYQDYWPQDYVFPAMREPVVPTSVLERWARKPLDFEPGTKWQYSNTNYTIAGIVIERAAGRPLIDFLRERVFSRLGMASVKDVDVAPLAAEDAAGYLRNALGPLRPAPKEAPGWLFAAGQLAMTAHDLARWDVSVIDQTILRPASYRVMQTDVLLASGVASGYGLGVRVATVAGRRQIAHDGAVSGYQSTNVIYPDERAAIVVLCNVYPGATAPQVQLAGRIAGVIFASAEADASAALDEARRIFAGLQQGKLDRAQLSPDASAYFSPEVVSDFAASLGPLGEPSEFVQTSQSLRGGMRFRAFRVRCGDRKLELTTRTLPDGRLEQFLVERSE